MLDTSGLQSLRISCRRGRLVADEYVDIQAPMPHRKSRHHPSSAVHSEYFVITYQRNPFGNLPRPRAKEFPEVPVLLPRKHEPRYALFDVFHKSDDLHDAFVRQFIQQACFVDKQLARTGQLRRKVWGIRANLPEGTFPRACRYSRQTEASSQRLSLVLVDYRPCEQVLRHERRRSRLCVEDWFR